MKKRTYTLYGWAAGRSPTNQTKHYQSGMWIVEIVAVSIKQAYFFYCSQAFATSVGELGIHSINSSQYRNYDWASEALSMPGWYQKGVAQ